MSQYDDPNDVKDDIQDGIGDSDILDHLMSDIDQNRAAQFGDEVLKLLDETNWLRLILLVQISTNTLLETLDIRESYKRFKIKSKEMIYK